MPSAPEIALKAVDKMPGFPKSVQQVLQLTANINCSPKDLVNVIKLDPVFTMRILKIVNSPFVGLAQKVTSIHQASVFLGINTIKNLALSLATIGALPRTNKAGFDMTGFWLHSLAVAAIARRLAERLGVDRNSITDYFSAGLLHDIGKGVFALYLPLEFKKALALAINGTRLFSAESQAIGINHAEIGALVAAKWGLPKALTQSIADHHAPLAQRFDLTDCVFAADQASKILAYGNAGETVVEPFPAPLAERFGAELHELLDAMPDLGEEMEKSRIFVQA